MTSSGSVKRWRGFRWVLVVIVLSTAAVTFRYIFSFQAHSNAGTPESRSEADNQSTEVTKLIAFVTGGGANERGDPEPVRGDRLVWVVVALAVATLVSEDLTCIGAGLLAARQIIPFWAAVTGSLSGIVMGDILLVLLGKGLRHHPWTHSFLRWFVRPEQLARSEKWLHRRGPIVALLSRFTPGMRLPTYVAAGVLNVRVARFSLYFLAAAALWTPLLVGISYWSGDVVFSYWASYEHYALPALGAAVLILWLLLKEVMPLATHRGRRLALSRWRRLTRWEFWPPWIFYPPLAAYICGYLALRYRSLTLFTLSNPAIPEGGFVGESKSAILKGLAGAADSVARWTLVPAGLSTNERLERLKNFMEREDLDYPVVLKPDQGQRGSGVSIVRSQAEAEKRIENDDVDLIAQEYIPGEEFGVFYVRYPDQERGFIFAVTEKRMPQVVGDGKRTLEELILAHPRAVCMARHFLRKHAKRLDEIPAEGAEIPLVDVGTHCLGAVFLDGAWIKTPALEEAIDRVGRTFDGFYFGRYDIRVSAIEAFQRGEGFKIVELNGVTSEATNIYDPRNSLWRAYRILMRQWRIAFAIGNLNRKRGMKPCGPVHLLRVIRAARKGKNSLSILSKQRINAAVTEGP